MSYLSNLILNYIEKNDMIDFVQIEDIFKQNCFQYQGRHDIYIKDNNLIWQNWNKEAISILRQVIEEIRIRGISTSECFLQVDKTVYDIYGRSLNLPIGELKKSYLNIVHWTPVVVINKNQ